jgi:hypothetical protein
MEGVTRRHGDGIGQFQLMHRTLQSNVSQLALEWRSF